MVRGICRTGGTQGHGELRRAVHMEGGAGLRRAVHTDLGAELRRAVLQGGRASAAPSACPAMFV